VSTYAHQLELVPEDEEAEAVRYPWRGRDRGRRLLSPENAGKSPETLAGWFVNDIDQTPRLSVSSPGLVVLLEDHAPRREFRHCLFDAGRFRAV
jgi:hypothetical protein